MSRRSDDNDSGWAWELHRSTGVLVMASIPDEQLRKVTRGREVEVAVDDGRGKVDLTPPRWTNKASRGSGTLFNSLHASRKKNGEETLTDDGEFGRVTGGGLSELPGANP